MGKLWNLRVGGGGGRKTRSIAISKGFDPWLGRSVPTRRYEVRTLRPPNENRVGWGTRRAEGRKNLGAVAHSAFISVRCNNTGLPSERLSIEKSANKAGASLRTRLKRAAAT